MKEREWGRDKERNRGKDRGTDRGKDSGTDKGRDRWRRFWLIAAIINLGNFQSATTYFATSSD